MIDRTTAYAKLIVSGKRISGRKEYLACKRHLDDLKRKNFDYKFDLEEAEKLIDLANELTIAEGSEQKRLRTRGFQNFIIGSLFGWRKKRTKERRYREAYIQVGRQNGKSFLAGEIANDIASFSGYHLGRVFCTATKQDQANIVWDEIAKFIRSDSELEELYKIREHDRTIVSKITGTEIKAIGRDTKSADGFRSVLAIVDEYHAHKNNQMYKLMLDGQIMVDSALTMAITTAGFDLNGACYEQYKFCDKVLEGVIAKESLFIYIAEMNKDDDMWLPENWAKANPLNLWSDDLNMDQEKIKRMAEKALEAKEKGDTELLNFMTKSLNIWVTYSAGSLLDIAKWKQCESDLTLEDMKGRECYLGIDLSQGGDLTSIGLVFPLDDQKVYVYSHSFMPELRLLEHEKTDEAPYRVWVNQGFLTLTSGAFGLKTDYKYILTHLKELIEKYSLKILAVGYDNHNASAFLSDLDFLGCDLIDVAQSAKSLSDCTVDFRQSVEAGQIMYDRRNALLSWSAVNAELVKNSFGEIKIVKDTVGARIDPIYSIIDAWKIMFLNCDRTPYDANEEFDTWEAIMKQRKEGAKT